MPLSVSLSAPLRQLAGGATAIELDARPGSVGALVAALTATHPAFAALLDESSGLLTGVDVFAGGRDVREMDGAGTSLDEVSRVALVAALPLAAAYAPGADPTRAAELSREEVLRYSRHLVLPDVAMMGQRRLKAARLLLVGAGGLGSPAALYLAAAGVGTIGIADFDVVDETNLQRQVLHDTASVGRRKTESARDRLMALNPHIEVRIHETRLTRADAFAVLGGYDVVIDGSDNFQTRYLTNDACFFLGIPNIYGSIYRFEGQASVFWGERGPCYRCLFEEPPPPDLVPSCAEGGVLGVLPGVVGSIQATEAIKLLLGAGRSLMGRLLLYDALAMRFREVALRKNPECPLCGVHRTIHELVDYDELCGVGRGVELAAATPGGAGEVGATELREWMAAGRNVQVLDVREPHEWDICHLPEASLMPLGTLAARLSGLDPQAEYVVHCKSGARSAKAIELMRAAGFARLHNLKGGILAWAREVDPQMPAY